MKAGSIFTWRDRAYVVDTLASSASSTSLTTHPATYDETVADLSIDGDLDLSAVSPADIILQVDSDVVPLQTRQRALGQQSAQSTGPTAPACKFSSAAAAVGVSYVCNASYAFPHITLTGELGLKDVSLRDVKGSGKARTLSVGRVEAKPIVSLTVSATQLNLATESQGKVLARAVIPIPSTLGFAQVRLPLSLGFKLPALPTRLAFAGDGVLSAGKLSWQGSVSASELKLASEPETATFTAKSNFIGMVGAAEVAFTLVPTLVAQVELLPKFDTTFASAGAYVKVGAGADLIYRGDLIARTQCVEISAAPAYAATLQASFNIFDLVKGEYSAGMPVTLDQDHTFSSKLGSCEPTMLGDSVTISRRYPDPSTVDVDWRPNTATIQVVSGTSDSVEFKAGDQNLTFARINPEANDINFLLVEASVYLAGGSVFDGFAISGFRHPIRSASIVSNRTGLTITPSFTSSEILLNMAGTYGQSTDFTLHVEFNSQ